MGILAFNLFGYRVLLCWREMKAAAALVSQFDKQVHHTEDLVEITILLQLHYQGNWKNFEQQDGEISVNGQHYRYVMCKVYNDSLVLLCIPNQIKVQLLTARDQFISLAADIQKHPVEKKSSGASNFAIYKFVNDYTLHTQQKYYWPPVKEITTPTGETHCTLLSVHLDSSWQPPDSVPTIAHCLSNAA